MNHASAVAFGNVDGAVSRTVIGDDNFTRDAPIPKGRESLLYAKCDGPSFVQAGDNDGDFGTISDGRNCLALLNHAFYIIAHARCFSSCQFRLIELCETCQMIASVFSRAIQQCY